MDYNNKNYDTGQNTHTHTKNIQIEHFSGHDFCAFNVCSVICFQFFNTGFNLKISLYPIYISDEQYRAIKNFITPHTISFRGKNLNL